MHHGEVFSRFMGGDLLLIPELKANHARQEALLEEGSKSPPAAFGEYVRAARPPTCVGNLAHPRSSACDLMQRRPRFVSLLPLLNALFVFRPRKRF